MADIIVFNALKNVEAVLSVSNGLAVGDLTQINTIIENIINNTTYINEYLNFDLNGLSCNQYIASCLCNYFGSGISDCCSTPLFSCNSPWKTFSYTGYDMFTRLKEKTEMKSIIDEINDLTSSVLRNNIYQYIENYALNYINNSDNEDIKIAWLGNGKYTTSDKILKVCHSCWCMGYNATCTWTVPTDTTEVKFQLWGAGAGTNPGCCCGGSPFGANGAYAELTLSVTPGDTYSICAGCACSIYCCSNSCAGPACMSGVTGPGICCLKADGGSIYNCHSMDSLRMTIGAGGCCGRYTSPYLTASGACWCGAGSYCSASCATDGNIPVYANCSSCDPRTYCACGTDTATVFGTGYASLHGGGCLDINNYGRFMRPPLLDADNCFDYCSGCRCACVSSGTCCGGCNGNSWTRHPGHGGAYTHVMGGTNTHFGGTGTGGMVQVSWK